MMPNGNAPNAIPNRRRPFRPKLRQATLILPSGYRVKRNVTFGPLLGLNENHGDGPADERSPFLGGDSSHAVQWSWSSYLRQQVQGRAYQLWDFAKSRTGRGVLKCSIAYLIGSLATFVPQISALLGQQDGKHMVATITVYFHPARSMGSMFEAIVCAAVAFAYAVFISFSSMGVSIFFGRVLENIVLGHILVLVIFCGGGLGFVGWVKQHLGHPLINISCSLTSLAIITVLTKEGAVQASEFSDDKVTQVMIMIAMGVCATTAVSFLIDPVSARSDLRDGMAQVTDSFADLLVMITQGFLTGHEEDLQQQAYDDALNKYRKLFTSLTQNLTEAKYEHYILGTEREYDLYAQLVNCMQRLGQSIGGLRSAATTEFWLLAQSEPRSPNSLRDGLTPQKRSNGESYFPRISDGPGSPEESHAVLESIDEVPENSSPEDTSGIHDDPHLSEQQSSLPSTATSSDIFSRFIMQLGPSMKSLAITLRKIMDELPFNADGQIAVNAHFTSSLTDAVKLYTSSRQEALHLLYKNKELIKVRPLETQADFEEVAASCGYFSFSLQDLASEMQTYLEILDALKLEVEERPIGRTWQWLKVWQRGSRFKRRRELDYEQVSLIDENEHNAIPEDIPGPLTRAAKTAKEGDITHRFRYKLWLALSFFRRDDIKFAVKVGIGAALYALPSFLASTRPFYQHWRGEWGLLSYMLVCAMTLGASNTTGYARFLGTCIGAVCAIVSWTIADGNGYLLAFFGWIMSLWTAYIILAQGKGPMGRFIMLTYNLSALYAYSLSVKDVDGDEDEGGIDPIITEIALHRVVAVLSGCLWGLIITRLIFPISARQKFKEGLSILWLRMGLIWKRDPLDRLVPNSPQGPAYMDLREELELHRFLTRLENLKGAAASEVNLKGPFPSSTYSTILKSTNAMLDAFHAMNVLISKNPRASHGEAAILECTTSERATLCASISHQFQILASSMKLEYPLNEALPSADNARDRLLAKMFKFRAEREGVATDEDFELLYAYALVTGQLSREILGIGGELEGLFGVLNEELLKLL